MNYEMQSRKWLWGGIAIQLGTGYTVAFLVYRVGTLITTGRVGNGFVPGLAVVAAQAAAKAAAVQSLLTTTRYTNCQRRNCTK